MDEKVVKLLEEIRDVLKEGLLLNKSNTERIKEKEVQAEQMRQETLQAFARSKSVAKWYKTVVIVGATLLVLGALLISGVLTP